MGVFASLLSTPWDTIGLAVYVTTGACWLTFGAILIIGKRGAAPGAQHRDVKSWVGFLLQLVAYAICFVFFRRGFSSLVAMPKADELALAVFTIALALISTLFCLVAARALGKQWALVARVIEGHELISRGPYAVVRNPIYLAMFGMLIALGLAFSRWQALIPAAVLFLIGTAIRIHAEESLLRANFGGQFDDYTRRVPAFFPRLL